MEINVKKIQIFIRETIRLCNLFINKHIINIKFNQIIFLIMIVHKLIQIIFLLIQTQIFELLKTALIRLMQHANNFVSNTISSRADKVAFFLSGNSTFNDILKILDKLSSHQCQKI